MTFLEVDILAESMSGGYNFSSDWLKEIEDKVSQTLSRLLILVLINQ